MRRCSILLASLLFMAAAIGAYAQTAPTIVTPAQLKWSSQGVPKGMMIATVAGDPSKTGPYVLRIKMDAGSKFPPHVHGDTERVTVLQGTLMAGIGSKWDDAKMKPLPAGTYVIMPAGLPHYVMAKDAVIIQINGMGPSSTKMMSGGGNMSM